MNFLIGSDPEIFIKNEDGVLSSIIGILNGTKDNPIDIGKGCSVQEDNILAEFNIPPAKSLEEFKNSINYSKDYIETVLAPLGKVLHYSSSEIVPKEVLVDPKANIFGCAPSFNVLTESISDVDTTLFTEEQKTMRSSGFHIHIGYDNPTEEMNDRLVMSFEIFVTLSLLNLDNDKYNRRSLYGLIGDSRSKSYGVECRSLGGYFLKNDESITLVWNQLQKALKFATESKHTNNDLKDMLLYCVDFENNIINTDNVNIMLEHLNIQKLELI